MRRTMTPERINALANDPEIRPWVGGEGVLDLTALVENVAVVTLEFKHGAFMLVPISETVYELHTMFLPEGRGADFFVNATEMFRYLFTRTPALEIVTKVPDGNRGAAVASTKAGFRERFHRAGTSFRSLSIERWALGDEACFDAGERFHDKVHAANLETGPLLPPHPFDEAHDHIVGAAFLIAYENNIEKGVDFYNQWAAFAAYPPVRYLGNGIVDMSEPGFSFIVEIRNQDHFVLACRVIS